MMVDNYCSREYIFLNWKNIFNEEVESIKLNNFINFDKNYVIKKKRVKN